MFRAYGSDDQMLWSFESSFAGLLLNRPLQIP